MYAKANFFQISRTMKLLLLSCHSPSWLRRIACELSAVHPKTGGNNCERNTIPGCRFTWAALTLDEAPISPFSAKASDCDSRDAERDEKSVPQSGNEKSVPQSVDNN